MNYQPNKSLKQEWVCDDAEKPEISHLATGIQWTDIQDTDFDSANSAHFLLFEAVTQQPDSSCQVRRSYQEWPKPSFLLGQTNLEGLMNGRCL